jgi:hypothetical protein
MYIRNFFSYKENNWTLIRHHGGAKGPPKQDLEYDDITVVIATLQINAFNNIFLTTFTSSSI